jgi:hypothetical protein
MWLCLQGVEALQAAFTTSPLLSQSPPEELVSLLTRPRETDTMFFKWADLVCCKLVREALGAGPSDVTKQDNAEQQHVGQVGQQQQQQQQGAPDGSLVAGEASGECGGVRAAQGQQVGHPQADSESAQGQRTWSDRQAEWLQEESQGPHWLPKLAAIQAIEKLYQLTDAAPLLQAVQVEAASGAHLVGQ